ncbi:MAG: glycosyltransferase [Deltaproteobacteria bacterium]|nr:glycosyltransferase [Deltaproteobacteria bacterium]MBF0507423.1 glycosyltransferase [Deltaproteobacteria bacterium]
MAVKRNILQVIDHLEYGGAQRLLVPLAEWIHKDTYNLTVCTLQTDTSLKAEIESKGVKVICLGRTRPSILCLPRFASYVYGSIRDLMNLCAGLKIDVIQCHLSDAEFLGIVAGTLSGVELILTTNHNVFLPSDRGAYDVRNVMRKVLSRELINRWADFAVAVSEDVGRRLRADFGVRPEKIKVIINGIDVNRYRRREVPAQLRQSLGLRVGNRVVTTVGRLSHPKGHTYLLQAIALLKLRFPELRLLLVGDGELKNDLRTECAALGLKDQVNFLGSRNDVSDILAVTDIFVLPSLWEGTSLALLEAMAAGKPIIATAIAGNIGIIEHNINGRLVPAGNVESLASAIADFLDKPEMALKYADNAYRNAERFDIRQTISELESLWSAP